jgi:[lysine-biosynthesis-protein LysW]--L-2-aminoadipate ligase
MKLAITFDRLRWEEKKLKTEAEKVGCETVLIDARKLALDISKKELTKDGFGDVVLQRCISHYRSLFLGMILDNYGIPTINTSLVAEVCGNKMLTTMRLAKAGVATPKTFVALSLESSLAGAEEVGFPIVLKPFTGSWGRGVAIVKDSQTLDTIVELKESLPNPIEHMYYIQEYVKRPPRDIRAIVAGGEIVASVYRNAPANEWRTNVARGATTAAFKPDEALSEIVLHAADAVGGGVLGVDAMESDDGYMVHEVNNTVEFRGAQLATKGSIAKKIISYVVASVKK